MNNSIRKIMKLTYLFVTCLSVLTYAGLIVLGVLNDELPREKVLSNAPKSCACSGRRDTALSAVIDSDASHESTYEEVPRILIDSDLIPHDTDVHDSDSDKFDNKQYNRAGDSSINSFESNMQNMVYIEGGSFYMGTDSPQIATDGEGPKRLVTLSNYMIDRYHYMSKNRYACLCICK
jgi:hypothetical protein